MRGDKAEAARVGVNDRGGRYSHRLPHSLACLTHSLTGACSALFTGHPHTVTPSLMTYACLTYTGGGIRHNLPENRNHHHHHHRRLHNTTLTYTWQCFFFFTDTDTVALLAHSLSVCPSVCRLPVSLVCHNMCVERVRWGGRWERRGEDSDREQLTCGTPRLPHHTGSLSASSLPNTLSLHTVSRGAPYTRPPTAAHNPRHDRIPTAPPSPRDKHKDMKDDDDRTAMGHSRH